MATTVEAKAAVPKLHYFPLCGRGDFIKAVFEDAGKPYEFVPHALGAHKSLPGLPYGQLPFLVEPCGNEVAQTGTIVRFLAKRFNMYPSNLKDTARAEAVADQTLDIIGQYFGFLFGRVDKAALEAYLKTQWGFLEAVLAKSESKGEYVTAGFTFADVQLWHLVQTLKSFVPVPPLLTAHHARIGARPRLAAYVASPRYIAPMLTAFPAPAAAK